MIKITCSAVILCVILAVADVKFSTAQGTDQCSESEIVKCVKVFQEQAKTRNKEFIYFPQDIDKFCKTISEYITCFRNKQKQCPKNNLTQLETFNSFKTELCTDGSSLRAGYIANQKCLVTTTADITKCKLQNISVYWSNLQSASKQSQAQSIKTMCCSNSKTEACAIKAVESKCGKDATKYVQGVLALGSPATLIVSTKCATYKHGTPACEGSSSGNTFTAVIALVFGVFLLPFA